MKKIILSLVMIVGSFKLQGPGKIHCRDIAVGTSKEHIMQTAIDFLGEECFGLSRERKSLWQNGLIFESLLETRRLCQRAPFVHFFI